MGSVGEKTTIWFNPEGTTGPTVLALLRQCAWAPAATIEDQNSPFHLAVSDLKNSQIWKDHESVHQWLSTKWLPIVQVCIVHVVNCMGTCVS